MLLINKSGRIYDVPDNVADQCVARDLGTTRQAIGDMLSALADRKMHLMDLPSTAAATHTPIIARTDKNIPLSPPGLKLRINYGYN